MSGGQMRTRQQYLGDLGEAEVYIELLHLGVSLNYLTQSDSGWDLHLHLPSDSIDVEVGHSAWNLSGRVAHVQVKKQTSTTPPELSVTTTRGWITGTRSGVPTFLFVADGRGRLRYATPRTLADWMDLPSTPTEGSSRTARLKLFDYSRLRFSKVLSVWSHFPNALLQGKAMDAMLHGSGLIDATAADGIIKQVALGWLNFAGLSYTGSWGDWERRAGEFYTAVDLPGFETGTEGHRVFEQELHELQSFHNDPGLPVATYSLLPDIEAARKDALDLLRLIFKSAAVEPEARHAAPSG